MRMGRRLRIGAVLGAFGVLSGLWTGCTAKKATELVAGISTQLKVPKDIRSIRVDVTSRGESQLCHVYTVTNGHVRLPRTLGLQSGGDPTHPVTITITGFTLGEDDPDFPQEVLDCGLAPGRGWR